MRKRILQLKAENGQVTIDGVTFQHPTDNRNIEYGFIVFYVPTDDNTIEQVYGMAVDDSEPKWKQWTIV